MTPKGQFLFTILAIIAQSPLMFGQTAKKPPIIDMHLHAMQADQLGPPGQKMSVPFENFSYNDPRDDYGSTYLQALQKGSWAKKTVPSPLTDDSLRVQTLRVLKENNIYAVTAGSVSMVRKWHNEDPKRIINATTEGSDLSIDSISNLFRSGEFRVYGEVTPQYSGYSLSDLAFEPYLKMAEDLDIPIGVHVGPGPPGAIYLGFSKYRASLHSAFTLEEALVRHPKLRVYAMHAGWPLIDDMIAVLYAHPQLYVDLGFIGYGLPEKEYYNYLERLVNAGFIKRIMFGSDNMVWPGTIKVAIDRINNAPFLTEDQKRDILFNNAARFLRLTPEEIKTMFEK
jgi:predicted TIM-barrel fold metal-dependent hydrolase